MSEGGDILRTLFALLSVYLTGLVLVLAFGATHGISRFIYFHIDFDGFIVAFGTAAITALYTLALGRRTSYRLAAPEQLASVPLALIASCTFAVAVLGTQLAYHGYALSMDEWMTRLQGEIFLSGHVSAVLPDEWHGIGRSLYHSFAAYDVWSGRVASDYRPGTALIYTAFEFFGLGLYASAVMNVGAILVVAHLARVLFPDRRDAPIVAALLLATSQQAIAAAMTSYAMTAHLLFNLAWIALFVRGTPAAHILAALLGVATAALHQIHLHLFFALPFLLTLLRPFRPWLILFYGGVYIAGHLAVYSWDWLSISRFVTTDQVAARNLWARAVRIFRTPDVGVLSTVTANIVRLIAWQSLALPPLLALARREVVKDRMLRLLAWSILTSLVPYLFLMPDQGHGWGYRYLHGLLGHLSLLAVPGWIWLADAKHKELLRLFVYSLLIVSPLVLIPFRLWQIEKFVGPYARATVLASSQDADIVIVDSSRVLSGQDIPRNSAVHLKRPLQIPEHWLTEKQIRELCAKYRIVFLDAEDLAELGVSVIPIEHVPSRSDYEARLRALKDPECGSP